MESSNVSTFPPRGGRGIQEAQVWEAADALVHEGLRPTIERVRQKIGSGSVGRQHSLLECAGICDSIQ
ncbi:DNA-binding protein [Variovorax sp. J31P179]|uniref:DNA-binding protein n=1 Tax=Variovorax sp. J31P179 TaxID=3053508 RepID=UPI0025759BA8|nr:DNA-binding protein [Variovorax sp. J31P179]MDM0084585.1 DNA-binding protein [Variovorax sp. J31P179]